MIKLDISIKIYLNRRIIKEDFLNPRQKASNLIPIVSNVNESII
jgi:hypothetical protein